MSELIEQVKALGADDVPTKGGRTLAYVYDSGLEEVDELARQALGAYCDSNGLDPTAFPSLMRMENELVGVAADLLDAPDTVVGTVTSGGTESCLLAVQSARDSRPDVERPRIVVPDTVHVMAEGRIRKSGGKDLALELEKTGYAEFKSRAA